MLTGFGIGAALSALVLLRRRIHRRAGVWVSALCALSGASLVAMALAPDLAAATAATVSLGVVSGPMAVTSSVLAQQHTPDAFRGRMSSFNLLSGYGTVPLASAGTGFGIGLIGITGTFAVCGLLEATTLLCLLAPAFRRATIVS
jgi:hypothetical protein